VDAGIIDPSDNAAGEVFMSHRIADDRGSILHRSHEPARRAPTPGATMRLPRPQVIRVIVLVLTTE
jgi:hypothetical protein